MENLDGPEAAALARVGHVSVVELADQLIPVLTDRLPHAGLQRDGCAYGFHFQLPSKNEDAEERRRGDGVASEERRGSSRRTLFFEGAILKACVAGRPSRHIGQTSMEIGAGEKGMGGPADAYSMG
jgi:hypothetical protein